MLKDKIAKFLPKSILNKFENSASFKAILENIGWLFFDKFLRMGVGLIVGLWVARYLGPEGFGLINFGLAFTGMFAIVSTLGLSEIVVRDLVKEPENTNITLGTATLIQFIGGVIGYILTIFVILYLRPEDTTAKTVVAILGAGLLFKASDTAKYWFESKILSKYVVWVQNIIFILISIFKIILILTKASIIYFALAIFIESAIISIIIFIVMDKTGQAISNLKFKFKRAKILLLDSWPLAISSLAIMIYMKIDQIMLGQMIGDNSVGIYSAALRLSEVWFFIPMSITASLFPSILKSKQHSEKKYLERFQKLFDIMLYISLLLAVPMTFLSSPLIELLYGHAYVESGIVLGIHIWTSVFVFMGVAGSKWYIAENFQKLSMQRTLLGVVLNIGLNLILIPIYGPIGAAISTVISQAFASWLLDYINPTTRIMFFMKLKSFNLLRLLKM